MKSDKVMETVKEFPAEFDLEELIEKLVFVEKVEKGLEQIKEGKTISHEKVKEMTKMVKVVWTEFAEHKDDEG
ncbi:MAG: hypothetical protein JNJ75_11420 [Cyclobacteriaceae bacterium]|nr:hypothetical protein [Cyclobacteriaceae bacterium]